MIYIKKGPEPEAFRQWKEPPPMRPMARFPGKLAVPCAMPISSPSRRTLAKRSIMAISLCVLQYRQAHEGRKALRRGSGEQGASCLSPAKGLYLLFLLRLGWRDLCKRGAHEEEQERANATISILRLNTNSLVTARYDAIEELETLAVEEREPLLDLLCKRNARGAFAPYYFVPLRHFQRI